MKKILLTALGSLAFFNMKAQITVTSSTIAVTGATVVQCSDTATVLTVKTGGANQTWNFSSLVTNMEDTLKFFTKSWITDLNGIGDDANLVFLNPESDNAWFLLKKTETKLESIGVAADTGNGPIAFFSERRTIMNFPTTYNSTFQRTENQVLNTYYLGMDPDGPGPSPQLDSIRVSEKSTITSNGIGWGNVKLTNSANVATIMVEEKTIAEPQYEYYSSGTWNTVPKVYYGALGLDEEGDTSYTHVWWSDKQEYGFPLITYGFEHGDATTKDIQHLKSAVQISSIKGTKKSYINIYPNPTNDILNLKNVQNSNANVKVFDVKGALVLNTNNITNGLDLSALQAGVYTIVVLDNNVMHQFKISKI